MRRAALIALVTTGCASAPVKRPVERFDFDGTRASYRVFSDDSICDTEPRFLADEFLSVNEVFKRFLRDTPATSDEPWSESHFTVMEDGLARLPPLVEQHRTHLKLASGCSFSKQGAWPDMLKRADTLLDGTRARLDVGPILMKEVRHRTALAEWNQQRLEQQESARRTCPAKLGSATIYFAYRDESERTSYLFCDGALVSVAEGTPKLEPAPAELVGRRAPPAKSYLLAAERYPKGAILTSP